MPKPSWTPSTALALSAARLGRMRQRSPSRSPTSTGSSGGGRGSEVSRGAGKFPWNTRNRESRDRRDSRRGAGRRARPCVGSAPGGRRAAAIFSARPAGALPLPPPPLPPPPSPSSHYAPPPPPVRNGATGIAKAAGKAGDGGAAPRGRAGRGAPARGVRAAPPLALPAGRAPLPMG